MQHRIGPRFGPSMQDGVTATPLPAAARRKKAAVHMDSGLKIHLTFL